MKFHRRLAKIVMIPVMAWAISGLLHPMMANWLRPSIAHTFLPPQAIHLPAQAMPPKQVFADLSSIQQLRLVLIDQKTIYQAITPKGKIHYRDPLNAQSIPDAERLYSIQLARAYADDPDSAVIRIEEIKEFNATYGYINRLLPVQRVVFDRPDGLQVVVCPRTGRLASFDTPSKRVFATLFSYLHTWNFLGSRESKLRIITVTVLSVLSLFLSISGIRLLLQFRKKTGAKQRPRKLKPARKVHRALGAVTSLLFLMFGISGLFHVIAKWNHDDSPQWQSKQQLSPLELGYSPYQAIHHLKRPVKGLSLAAIDGKAYYRVALMDRSNPLAVAMIDARSGESLPNGEKRFAQQLALEFSGYSAESVTDIEAITSFRKDYGFIFKRLPVWRVHFQGQKYFQYTVDTADAHMSMRTSTGSLIETMSFLYLHKWHFLDFLGRDARDYGTAAAVILILTSSFAGVLLLRRKQRNKQKGVE